MAITIKVEGLSHFEATLRRQLSQLENKVDDRIHRAGDNTVEGAQERSPVLTGTLKSGYEAEHGHLESTVKNDVKYGIWVENGHRTSAGTHVSARPMLWPAFEEESRSLERDLKNL